MPTVYLGLGSNQQQPEQQILQAIERLHALPDSYLTKVSSLYRTAAITHASQAPQPDFINAVVLLKTLLPPNKLLQHTQRLEHMAGRSQLVDREYWGPRPLDIDILLYDNYEIHTPQLTVPHLRMLERRFVLEPLLEINSSLRLPNSRQSLENLVASCSEQFVEKTIAKTIIYGH